MEKVVLLIDKDGWIIYAGKVKGSEINKCVKAGGSVKTITIDEYRNTFDSLKWIYDKPNPTQP